LLAAGQSIEAVCKKLEVSAPTYHRWRQEYGGAKQETVKRLKELDKENARLKRLVADLSLDKAILKEIAEGNEVSRSLFSSKNKRQNGRPGAQTRSGAARAARAGSERAPSLHDDPTAAQHATLPRAQAQQGRGAGRGVAAHLPRLFS
jgi:transposase-like protein